MTSYEPCGWFTSEKINFSTSLSPTFALPPYGYLFLTPPHPSVRHSGSVGVKSTLYSFSFYRDIKEFLLKKFTFGSDLVDPAEVSEGGTWGVNTAMRPTHLTVGQPFHSGTKVNRAAELLGEQLLLRVQRIRFKPGYARI